jgi:ADP-ribosylglycohydrolase
MTKKAWELEYETMKLSMPVVLDEEEQGWSFAQQVEALENEYTRMKWHSAVPGSGATEHVIVAAMQDMENMGYDVTAAEALIDEGMEYLEKNDMAALAGHTARVFHVINNSPKLPTHPYWSYTCYESFEQYRSAVRFPVFSYDRGGDDFEKRTYYGWQAQICAGAIGTAMEGYLTENIRKVFGEVYSYVRKPNTFNDDITYELALMEAVEKMGAAISSADIAEQWVALIPMGWSAEDVAIKNLKLGIFPPESGRLNNPYREWIGAQMRGAVCGMLYPGDVENAARLAFMDGQVSHHNNGVLGEVFNAVMASLAYVEADVRAIVKQAIELIPSDSEYYSVVRFALDRCLTCNDWESAWKQCESKYVRYNWIHAYPNAAAEVIALWFGNGSFDETMHISAMQGYDVDCNAAQIGTVVAIANNHAIDEKWTKPIGDVLNTYMRDCKTLSIRALAKRTVAISKRLY